MTTAQQQGRRTLILISLLFSIPIIAAMYMYFSGTAVPVGSTEHGDLISPPRLLPDTALNGTEPVQQFRSIWSLVVLAENECDTACQTSLENIRQIRLSLGPKMARMQTVYLPASSGAIPAALASEHPRLIVVEPAASGEIRQVFGPHDSGQVFMVDPLGNLMMSYPAGTEMGDIRKDIAHLLKLSGIG